MTILDMIQNLAALSCLALTLLGLAQLKKALKQMI